MINNEDEIETINERQDLLSKSKKVVKSRSLKYTCCKGLLIATAVSIFIAMIVQVYSDYSSFLETHSLPPAIHSMSSHCMGNLQEHCMTKNYNAPSCTFQHINHTSWTFVQMVCETSKPSNHMVQTNVDHLLWNMTWDDKLVLTLSNSLAHCVHLTIWSI